MVSKQTSDAVNGSREKKRTWNTPESVQAALEQTKGKVAGAARLLGVSRATLRHRLKELKAAESNGSGHVEVAESVFKHPMYDLSLLSPEKWDQKRPCWYCGIMFAPERRNCWDQHFCCDDHRTTFNKWGYLPYQKLMLAIQSEIRRQVAALVLESFIDKTVSKSHTILLGMLRSSDKEQRLYIRKTVASMISNPERVRKTLEAVESGAELPE